jgi:hypothetical protein
MNLVEVMVASVLFVLASSCSAQVWGQSVAWSQRVEQRREVLQRLDADLLRQEHTLRQAAAAAVPALSCQGATDWMRAQLTATVTDLPEGIAQHLESPASGEPGALWLVVGSQAHRIERRRLFTAAAHGLCLPEGTDSGVGA